MKTNFLSPLFLFLLLTLPLVGCTKPKGDGAPAIEQAEAEAQQRSAIEELDREAAEDHQD